MDHGPTPKKARLEGGHLHVTSQERRRQEALQGVSNGTVSFRGLPAELRDDAEIALAAIPRNLYHWNSFSVRLKRNKEFVLAAVKVDGRFLECASEELRGDREIVREAVRKHGHSLYFAARELRADREIVLEAVRQNGEALGYASRELRGNHKIVLEAVRQNGDALQFASRGLRGSHGIVLAAVRECGYALVFASEELRANREIVLAAVGECGHALEFASEELRGDREVVWEALRQNGKALRHASAEIRGDREVVLSVLHNDNIEWRRGPLGDVQEFVLSLPDNLQNDPIVAGGIIRIGGRLRWLSELVERVEKVLLSVEELPDAFVENLVDEESDVVCCNRWESLVWHKIWMVLRLEPPGMEGTGQVFVELSGLPLELQQARDWRYCAPVIGAVLSLSRDWRNIKNYATRVR